MKRRRLFIAANWKMNTDRESAGGLAAALADQIGNVEEVDVAICPPAPFLMLAQDRLSGSRIHLGAQNMHFEPAGAFTGEISSRMLISCGCKYVIIGHSERRHVFGEDDELINRKTRAAVQAMLLPILCVGEQLAEREAGKTNEVVEVQLRRGLLGVLPEQLRQITIAYEPVWAIGTGKVATPDQAEDAHASIRTTLTRLYGADLAQAVRIQYGGSVKADNVATILGRQNVDGALVGGASLKCEEFAEIVRAAIRVASAPN